MATGTIPKYMDGEDTGWQDIAISSIMQANTGTLQYRRQGNFVEIRGSALLFKEAVTDAYAKVLNAQDSLPSSLRPGSNTIISGCTGVNYPAYAAVFANGNIAIYKPSYVQSITNTWPIAIYGIYSL